MAHSHHIFNDSPPLSPISEHSVEDLLDGSHHAPESFLNLFSLAEHTHHHGGGHHHHHHEHSSEPFVLKTRFQQFRHRVGIFVDKIAAKIKSVDGIDETAHLIGQGLPGIIGPIASSTILAIAIPFVWLGVSGMHSEYKSARHELEAILKRKASALEKLKSIKTLTANVQQSLAKKYNLDIDFQASQESADHITSERTLNDTQAFAFHLASYNVLIQKEMIAQYGKKYGWTGILGMGAMFGGMFPALTASGLELAAEISTGAEAIEHAASIAGMAAGGTFLVGQAAMAFYAGNRWRQGKTAANQLKKSKSVFLEQAKKHGVSEETISHVTQIYDKMLFYLNKHSIQYGKLTIAGQAAMAAGTIAGMSGAGIAVTSPLFAVGAPLTIGAAISRIVYQGKEKRFKGKETPLTKAYCKDFGLSQPFDSSNSPTIHAVLHQLDEQLTDRTADLAKLKLLSLAHTIQHQDIHPGRKLFKPAQKSVDAKLALLQKPFQKTGKLKSQLENAVVQQAKAAFESNTPFYRQLFSNNNCYDQQIIEEIARIILQEPELQANYFQRLVEKLGLEEHPLYKDRKESSLPELTRLIIKTSKNSYKALRFYITDALIHVCHAGQIMDVIEQAEPKKNIRPEQMAPIVQRNRTIIAGPMKPTYHPISRTTPNQLSTPMAEHAHNPHTLPDHAFYPEPHDSPYQQLAQSLLEQKPTPPGYTEYRLINEVTDKHGNHRITYQHPFDPSEESNIIYIITPAGKLANVEHGANSSAVIPEQHINERQLVGISLHLIEQGHYTGIISRAGKPIGSTLTEQHFSAKLSDTPTYPDTHLDQLSKPLPAIQEQVTRQALY